MLSCQVQDDFLQMSTGPIGLGQVCAIDNLLFGINLANYGRSGLIELFFINDGSDHIGSSFLRVGKKMNSWTTLVAISYSLVMPFLIILYC